jgi:hypothetical protein
VLSFTSRLPAEAIGARPWLAGSKHHSNRFNSSLTMARPIIFSLLFILVTFVANGQNKVIIDGDKLHLRDSLEGKVILLTSIERGSQNQDALWITYNRKPNANPWIKDLKELDKNFVKYWNENGVSIFGALITYDDCLCSKMKTMSSPDMYLIHFKISTNDWTKMKELYPEIQHDSRRME